MRRLVMRSVSALVITTLVVEACSSVGSPTGSPTPSVEPQASPSIVLPTASTAAPTPDPTEPARAPGASWSWVQTGTPGQAVTAGGPGWVLVGSDAPIQDRNSRFHVPSAWTSVDGRAWTRSQVALPSDASHGDATVVAHGPQGLVAAGTVGLTVGTVWQSEDGGSWDVIGTGSLFDLGPCFEGCARMTSIAAGQAGIVVSGYRVSANLEADVWVSADGTAWRRLALPAPVGGGVRVAAETSVTATPSGFLAVGSVCRSDGTTCHAVTWTSEDGLDWRGPTDLPSGAGCGALRAVVGGDRIVVLGQRCTNGCRYTAWSSANASSWAVADLIAGDVSSQERGLLTFAGGRFLAIGSRGDAIEVWSSADGLAWQKEALEPGSFVESTRLLILDLAGRGDAALATGLAGEGEQPGIWTSP